MFGPPRQSIFSVGTPAALYFKKISACTVEFKYAGQALSTDTKNLNMFQPGACQDQDHSFYQGH